MVNWIVIGIIIFFVFLLFKITSFRYERWWNYLIAISMILLLFSFFNVINKNEIKINSFDGFISGAKIYASWLFSFGKNVAGISGQVTSINWNATQNLSMFGAK